MELDDQILKLILGYARITISEYMNKWEFGKYNRRLLDQKQVADLKKTMKTKGIRWYHQDAFLQVLVPDASVVEISSLTRDATLAQNLPDLVLTESGKQMEKIPLASG